MSTCEFTSPNGKPSLLYARLEQEYGPVIARDVWYKIHTTEFESITKDEQGDPEYSEVVRLLNPTKPQVVSEPKLRTISGQGIISAQFKEAGVETITNPETSLAQAKKEVSKAVYKLKLGNNISIGVREKIAIEADQLMSSDSLYMASSFPKDNLQPAIKILGTIANKMNKPAFVYDTKGKQWFEYKNDQLTATDVINFIGIPYVTGSEVIPSGELRPIIEQWKALPMSAPINENSVAAMLESLDTQTGILPIVSDTISQKYYSVPVLDAARNPTGEQFSDEEFDDILSALLAESSKIIRASAQKSTSGRPRVDMKQLVDHIINNFLTGRRMQLQPRAEGKQTNSPDINKYSVEETIAIIGKLQKTINSIRGNPSQGNPGIFPFLAQRLNEMGFSIKGQIIEDQIKTAYNDNQMSDTTELTVAEEEVRGIVDYSKSAININPIDSASMRVKMFLASTPECRIQESVPSKNITRMPFNATLRKRALALLEGTKMISIRTTDQVEEMGVSLERGKFSEGVLDIDGKLFKVTAVKQWSDSMITEGPTRSILVDEGLMKGGQLSEKVDSRSVVYEITPLVPTIRVTPIRGSLSTFKTADFQRLFADVLTEMGGRKMSNTEMIARLKQSDIANIRYIGNALEKELGGIPDKNGEIVYNEQLVNEFNKVMTQRYGTYSITMYKISNDGKSVNAYNVNANNNQATQLVTRQWKENFKDSEMVMKMPNGGFMVNRPLAEEFHKRMTELNPDNITARNVLAHDFLLAIGIDMPDVVFDPKKGSLANEKIYKGMMKGTGMGANPNTLFQINAQGKATGLLSTIISRLAGRAVDTFEESDSDVESLIANNPFDTESRSFRPLAKMVLRHNRGLVIEAANHRNAEGKTVFNYSAYSYETRKLEQLKTAEYRTKLENIKFNKGSRLSKLLDADNEIRLSEVDGLKDRGKPRADGKARQDQSDVEQEFMSIMLFQNGGRNYSNFIDFTKSDKTRSLLWEGVQRIQKSVVSVESNGNYILKHGDNVTKGLYSIFNSEFDRICEWYQKNEQHKEALLQDPNAVPPFNDERFSKGGGLFYLLPYFNYDYMQQLKAEGKINDSHIAAIWDSKGKPALIAGESKKDAINAVIKNTLADMERAIRTSWESKGIINPIDKTHLFDTRYVRNQIHRNLNITDRDRDGKTELLINGKPFLNGDSDYYNLVTGYAIKDYLSHHMVMYADIARTISGDPAMTYKGKDNTSEIEQVVATMIEYQKRLAKDIAPGKEGAFDPGETYRAVTFLDYESGYTALGKEIPAYKKGINGTDAQEVTTVREHLYVMFKNGEIRDKVYKEMVGIVDAGLKTPTKYYEFTKPDHKAVIMQIMKPVYVGERFEEGQMYIDYIKSSSYPLYPPFTKGKEIDKLRLKMEGNFDKDGNLQNHINRGNFISAKKMGAPLQSVALFNEDGTINEEAISTQFPRATTTLNRDNFRIQQDVPYDSEKEKILTPSQANKLIIAGLPADTYFGSWGDAGDIRNTKELIRKVLIQSQFKELFADIANPAELVDRIKDMSVGGGYSLNEIIALTELNASGLPKIPFALSPVLEPTEKLLMSMVTKATQVKVYGKSFVQASSAGITSIKEGVEGLQGDIIWAPGYDGSELQMTKVVNGKMIATAQVLIPQHLLGEDFESLMLQSGDEGFVAGKRIINTQKVDPKLLEMLAFRIPNQGHNSMLPLEIVGFLPENMGDMIVVPKGITVQMGSDFDVDKLYIYKRPYTYNKDADQKFTAVEPVTNITALQGALDGKVDLDNKQLIASYFQLHWDILTHPDMMEKVLSPLDKPDLKDEIVGLPSPMNYMQFINPTQQLLSFSSQKDAKKLVGTSSLFLTQMSQLETATDVKLVTMIQGISVPKIITIEVNGKKLNLSTLSGIGRSEYIDPKGKVLVRTKYDNLATQQNAFLDHAKEPIADKLNITVFTFPASAVLSMLSTEKGEAVDLRMNARLMRQPILMRYNELMQRNTGTFGNKKVGKEEIIQQLYEELKNQGATSTESKTILSPELLQESLDGKMSKEKQIDIQVAALNLFTTLDKIAEKLQKTQRALNYDSKGVGANTMQAMDKAQAGVEVINYSDDITGLGVLFAGTEAGYIREQSIQALTALDPILNTEVQGILNSRIAQLFGIERVDESTGRTIRNGYKSFVLSKMSHTESAYQDRIRLLHGPESVVKQLKTAKETWGRTNYFIQRLSSATMDELGHPEYVTYEAGVRNEYDDERIPSLWSKMIVSEDPQVRKFGQDLFKYSLLLGGVQEANNIAKFIPSGYLIDSGLADEMTMRLQSANAHIIDLGVEISTESFQDRFTYQWAQNNPYSLKQIPDEAIQEQYVYETAEEIPSELMTLQWRDGKQESVPVEIAAKYNPEERRYYVYKSSSIEGVTIYTRIDTLGSSYMYEFDGSIDNLRSTVQGNRSNIKLENNFVGSTSKLGTGDTKVDEDLISFSPLSGRSKGIVPPGVYGNEEADKLLEQITLLPTTSAPLQLLGQALLPIMGYDRFYEGDKFEVDIMSRENVINLFGKEVAGAYVASANKIVLNNQAPSFAETFIHEALHSTSIRTVSKMLSDPDSQKAYPELYRHVMELEQLRQGALKIFLTDNPTYADRMAEISKGNIDPNNELDRVAYHLSNVNEIITGSLTNQTFQKWAASKQYKERSIMSSLTDWVSGLITAIGKSIGVKVPENSVLHQAIQYSLNITRLSDNNVVSIDNNDKAAQEPLDPKYELFPGVFANVEQRTAMDRLEAFFGSDNKQFLLSGAGGTGKTTVIQKIAKTIPGRTAYCAPTNAAKQTLAASGDIPPDGSFTVAQMLNMEPDTRSEHLANTDPNSVVVDGTRFRVITDQELYKRRKTRRIKDFDTIVIDESSMVDDKLVELIQKYKNPNAKIVWMGDYAQLEPVGQENEAWPFRNLTGDPMTSAILVKNERSRAQDIVSVVNKYRRGVNSAVEKKPFNMIPVPFLQRVNSKNIKYLKGQEAFQTIVKTFQENSGIRDVSVLATTNAMVDNVNTLVRDSLFGEGAEPFQQGERLVSSTNIIKQDAEGDIVTVLANSEMAAVKSREVTETRAITIGSIPVPASVTIHPIVLETEGGLTINVNGLSVEDWNKVDKFLRTMKYANGRGTLGDGNTYQYSEIKRAQQAFASSYPLMKPGYAMTVHKAQGCSIKHTFVMEDNIINGAPKFSAKNKIKSLYTAVSRASEKLYIVNRNNPNNTYKLDIASKVRDTEFKGLAGPYEFDNTEDARVKAAELTSKYPGLSVDLYRDAINPLLPKMEIGNLATVPTLKELGTDVSYNPMSNPVNETQSRLEKLVAVLRNNQNQLLNARREATDPTEKAILSGQIEEANIKLAELEGNMDLITMRELAEHQLKWVQNLLDGKTIANGSTINYAIKVTDTWQNITNFIYGDEAGSADQSIMNLQGRANNLLARLKPMEIEIIKKWSNGNLNTDDFDFTSVFSPSKLKSIMSSAELYLLDLSRVDNKFAQQMAKFLQGAAANRNESIRRLQGTITEYDTLYNQVARQLGITRNAVTEKLLQETKSLAEGQAPQTHWGLVREYSREYWDGIEKRQTQLSQMLADPKITNQQAYTHYRKETAKVSFLVNVNKLMTPGAQKFTYTADELENMFQNKQFDIPEVKYYAEIRKETPDAFMAKKLILRAQSYLDRYQSDLDNVKLGLDSEVTAGTKTSKEASDLLNNWIATNSPYYYMEYLTGFRISQEHINPQGYKYLQRAPKISYNNGEYYDKKYWDIFKNYNENNPTDLQKLHMMTSDMMKEFKGMLPGYINKNMGSNFLPGVKNSMIGELRLDKTLLKTIPEKVIEMLTAEGEDMGDTNMIPVRYTAKLAVEEASQDLPLSLLKFGTMAYHYQNMSAIKDIVEIGQHLINRAIANAADESTGQNSAQGKSELDNLQKAISYTTNVLMYQKSRYLEGQTSKKLYTLNPLKSMRITNALRELNGRQIDLDKEFEDGKIGNDQYQALSLKIATDKQQLFDSEGIYDTNRTVHGSRVADFLIRYQTLKSLSYNPISAFSNMSFGMISLFIHGSGQQDFTNAHTTKAIGMMMAATKRWGTFGAWESPEAMKVRALVERLNIMGDIVGIDYHDNVDEGIKSRKKSWGRRLDPYAIMKSSDFFAKGSIAVSMALAKQVIVTENGEQKEISLYQALNDNGEWNTEKYGESPAWFSEDPSQETEFNSFRAKSVKVTKKIMGNQDPNSPMYGKKFTLVRLLGQFRLSWLAEGFMSRFEDEKADIDLERQVKGRYRTYADLGLGGSIATLGRMIMSNFTGADAFTGRLADGRKLSEQSTDIANMKMNLMEIQFGLGIAAACLFVGHLLGEADDDDKWLQVTFNLLYRNFQDTIFYLDPSTTMDILRAPIPAMSVITDIQKAIGVTLGELTGDDPADISRIILKWTKAGVPIPFTALINKVDYIMNQNLSDIAKSR